MDDQLTEFEEELEDMENDDPWYELFFYALLQMLGVSFVTFLVCTIIYFIYKIIIK